MSVGHTVHRPSASPVRLAEHDLIRQRLPLFAIVWIAASTLWGIALARRGVGSFDATAVAAIIAAEIGVLSITVWYTRRTSSATSARVVVRVTLLLLGLVWSIAASHSDALF